jgi:hypothetical protein
VVHSIIVTDTDQIEKLAETLPKITAGVGGQSRYVPVLTTGSHQLVLVEDGSPVMAYKVGSVDEASTLSGIEVIEKFISRFHDRKHLVMLYDDPKLARRVEFGT